MSKADQIRKLRDGFNQARRRGKHDDALLALRDLERLEPDEPRWPHQMGEIQRRLGRTKAAADAYEKAIRGYAKQGFVPRAMALGKAMLQIAPERTYVLEEIDPKPAREAHRTVRPRAYPQGSERPPALRASVVPLARATDSKANEIRFEDLDEADVIELDVGEIELLEDPAPLPMAAAPADPDLTGTTLERLAVMPNFPLFAELASEVLSDLIEAADLIELTDGAFVLRAGDPADALYCVVDGAAKVTLPNDPEAVLSTVVEGEVFGESCLLDRNARRTDMIVQGGLTALRIPKVALDIAVAEAPQLGELLFELLTRRLLSNLMRTSPLFAAFEPESRRELALRFELRSTTEGAVLAERGLASDGLYVVLEGAVRVVDEHGEEYVAGPGSIFGQRSLLSREPSEIHVSSVGDCIFLRLPGSRFGTFAALYPPALAHLANLSEQAVIPGGVDRSSLLNIA